MEYFSISKSDRVCKTDNKIKFKGGYSFNQRISITLYNQEMINYVFTKKINMSLKSIIDLYLLYENDEDGDAESVILPKIDLLRSTLLDKYSLFLGRDEIDKYILKLDKLEKKVNSSKHKKNRTR